MFLIYLSLFFIFLSIIGLVVGLFNFYSEIIIRKRLNFILKNNDLHQKDFLKDANQVLKLKKFLQPIFKYSIEDLDDNLSESSLKFIRAGLSEKKEQIVFLFIKFFSSLFIPILILCITVFLGYSFTKIIFLTILGGCFGFLVPDLYLIFKTKTRKNDIQNFLPDFIDLMVMCTIAGLGIDATLNRVSIEMLKSCPTLANEFHLCCLEIRAGTPRTKSLKNLAKRINLEEFNTFVSMLVQAEKLGTSLAKSLEIQSEFMRVKRMQRAEELASKIPVKMLLPLIFFIFPILMFVLVGPAIIQMTLSTH